MAGGTDLTVAELIAEWRKKFDKVDESIRQLEDMDIDSLLEELRSKPITWLGINTNDYSGCY